MGGPRARRAGWVLSLLLAVGLVGSALGEAPGKPAVRLSFWLTQPVSTPTRPLIFGVVGRDDAGRLVDPGPLQVSASAGEVEAAAAGTSLVRVLHLIPPPSHVGPLTLRARSGSLEAEQVLQLTSVEGTRLELTVDPPALVKGPEARAQVTVKVAGESGGGVPPILHCNLGSLGPLEKVGEGIYQAEYRPSEKLYPEVAIVTAFQPFPDAGSPAFALAQAAVPLSASIVLPGKTRPRVQMSVEIAKGSFGPVPSDARGRFEVPVIVPPGHGKARGVSIDRLGNRRITPIDLHLPPTNRLAVTAHPRTLLADGHARAQVVITVIDAFGRPTAGEVPRLSAAHGSISEPVPAGEGIYRAWYRAPPRPGEGRDRLTVTLRRRVESRAELELLLLPGRPERVDLQVAPTVLSAPSSAPASLTLSIADGRGSPVGEARVAIEARRGTIEGEGLGPFSYAAPETPRGWEDALTVRVAPPLGRLATSAAIDPEAGRILLLATGGRPVPGVEVRIGEGPPQLTDEEGALPLPEEGQVLDLQWSGRRESFRLHRAIDVEGRGVVFPLHRSAAVRTTPVVLMEPEPVVLQLSFESSTSGKVRVRWTANATAGKRKVRLRVGGRAPQKQKGQSGEWSGEAAIGELVTVTDEETGVMVVGEVPAP